jgi:hypothetical protein
MPFFCRLDVLVGQKNFDTVCLKLPFDVSGNELVGRIVTEKDLKSIHFTLVGK